GLDTPCMVRLRTWDLDQDIAARLNYSWIVGTDINNEVIPPGQYRVRVCKAGSAEECDDSSNYFTIADKTLVRVSSTGGRCVYGLCRSELAIQPNGQWVLIMGDGSSKRGQLSNSQIGEINRQITTTNFADIKSRPFAGTC